MDFIMPVIVGDKKYLSCVPDKPRGVVVADTTEEMRRTGEFGGMIKLISGCLRSITDDQNNEITNRQKFESIVRKMPIHLGEVLALRILTMINDAGVEQYSVCPRCKRETLYSGTEALTYDDLEIRDYNGDQVIDIELEDPIEIKSKGEIFMNIESIQLQFPTLNDGITGSLRVPENKTVRRQYAIYGSALKSVNGNSVDEVFRKQWGAFIFERMYTTDIEKISKVLNKIGIKRTIDRECSCGKKWKDPVNVSDFFDSGLQQF